MNDICGSQDTVGDYKDASRANHGVSLVLLIMFVNTFEFISQDMIHTCVAQYNGTETAYWTWFCSRMRDKSRNLTVDSIGVFWLDG